VSSIEDGLIDATFARFDAPWLVEAVTVAIFLTATGDSVAVKVAAMRAASGRPGRSLTRTYARAAQGYKFLQIGRSPPV
jgi:hypothetical protein